MPKKILFTIEFLVIAYILCAALSYTGHIIDTDTGGEIPVFLPDNNIPVISVIPIVSEPTVEEVEATTEKITEEEITTEIIEVTPVAPTIPTYIRTAEETTETTTVSVTVDEPSAENEEVFEIEPYDGPEQFAELYEIIAKYGKGVSVFYKDIKSGEEYFYNPDENYFIASLIKAPYAVYVYRCILAAEEGETNAIDLEQKYEYIESDYREGTGKIKDMEFGTEFTVEELIAYAIRWSDNVSMDKLRKIFPVSGFREFAAEIGLPHIADIRSSAVNGIICVKCAAAYTQGIYDFIEEGNTYSETLKEHMLNTINRMIYANSPFVRKYGWAEDSFHDMGIVYNETRPYLIAILSDRGLGDFPMFREISLAIQQYNDSKADEPEETENNFSQIEITIDNSDFLR